MEHQNKAKTPGPGLPVWLRARELRGPGRRRHEDRSGGRLDHPPGGKRDSTKWACQIYCTYVHYCSPTELFGLQGFFLISAVSFRIMLLVPYQRGLYGAPEW